MAILSTQQARLQDDLRGLIGGDVRCDDIIAQLYATDGSLFEYRPAGVVWPRSTKDVAATVAYCAENGIPVHPRGSGTTSSGGSLGPGIVLDFTRYMRRILHAKGDSVVVQPGAIRERFNDIQERSTKRFFAPSVGFLTTNTLGCIVSTDVAGPRWLKYGFPHEYVEELEIVTATGETLEIAPIDWPTGPGSTYGEGAVGTKGGSGTTPGAGIIETSGATGPEKGGGYWEKPAFQTLLSVLERYKDAILAEEPDGVPTRAGFHLRGLLTEGRLNPIPLFTGAEGALGIITKIQIRTSKRPAFSGGAILLFDSLENTARAVEPILESDPSMCELIDRRVINMLCQRDERFAPFLPTRAEYALLIELQDDSAPLLGERLIHLATSLRTRHALCFGSILVQSPTEWEIFSEILKNSELALLGMGESFQVIPLFDDLRVPVPALPDFLAELQNLLKRYNQIYSLGGHFGQGQVRVTAIRDLRDSSAIETFTDCAEEIASLVVRFGGAIGSARGGGFVKPRFLPRFFPKLFPAFTTIKRAFDPKGIMNPQRGVILPEFESYFESSPKTTRDHSRTVWGRNLRVDHHERDFQDQKPGPSFPGTFPEPRTTPDQSGFTPSIPLSSSGEEGNVNPLSPTSPSPRPNQLEVQFGWNRRQIASDVFQCAGCGLCRSRTSGIRMCPAFRHFPDESASCRAKANVLRGVLDGTLPLETLMEDSLKTIGDLCLNCHCCRTECPTETDIPKLVFRIESAYAAAHGLSLTEKILSRFDQIFQTATFFSCSYNMMMGSRFSRWLLEHFLGIAQGRRFPKLGKISYLSKATWSKRSSFRGARKPTYRVVLFLDVYANYFDSQLVEAAKKVLEHNGVEVLIPLRQKSSGYQAIAFGDRERAEALSRVNVQLLADYVRQGYEIVTLEPISSICLSREYLWLRDDPETRLVADRTTDISSFLYRLHQEGNLAVDFTPLPMTIGYHAPCRTLALTGQSATLPTPAEELLRLIPRLTVKRLERGCCGLAGVPGFLQKNHMMGLRLGMRLFLALRDSSIVCGATECNFCRLQMEQGTNKTTLHPIKYLACAYGFLSQNDLFSGKKPPKD